MSDLEPHEWLALKMLEYAPHCIGAIDSEEKLAAALVFAGLHKTGLALSAIGKDGPTFSLSDRGKGLLTMGDAP